MLNESPIYVQNTHRTNQLCGFALGRIKNLIVRKEKFQTSQVEIEKSLSELEQVQSDQKTQLKNLEHTIERKRSSERNCSKRNPEAEKIASSAKDAVIEFATQRDLAATIAN